MLGRQRTEFVEAIEGRRMIAGLFAVACMSVRPSLPQSAVKKMVGKAGLSL
jgi:hypothetical protein